MGISATEFWNSSKNGKAMLVMLARNGDVELVRDICEWLVDLYEKDAVFRARQAGATEAQAGTLASEQSASIRRAAEGITDRSVVPVATQIVDAVFKTNYDNGTQSYTKAMASFAEQLRAKVK